MLFSGEQSGWETTGERRLISFGVCLCLLCPPQDSTLATLARSCQHPSTARFPSCFPPNLLPLPVTVVFADRAQSQSLTKVLISHGEIFEARIEIAPQETNFLGKQGNLFGTLGLGWIRRLFWKKMAEQKSKGDQFRVSNPLPSLAFSCSC